MAPADVADDTLVPNALPAYLHRIGWTVKLRKLERRHDLNGVEGEVHSIPHHEGRVCMRLETGEYVRARPENTEILRTGPLVSLGGIVRALRFARHENTTGTRCPTSEERDTVEALVLRAAAHSAQENGWDASRAVSRTCAMLKNFTENEWWSDEFVLVDELVPGWLRCHGNAAAGGEVRTVDSTLLRKMRANFDAMVEGM